MLIICLDASHLVIAVYGRSVGNGAVRWWGGCLAVGGRNVAELGRWDGLGGFEVDYHSAEASSSGLPVSFEGVGDGQGGGRAPQAGRLNGGGDEGPRLVRFAFLGGIGAHVVDRTLNVARRVEK